MALVIPSIEQLQAYEGGKPIEELARELGITDAVKLASNENPARAEPSRARGRAARAGRREPLPPTALPTTCA